MLVISMSDFLGNPAQYMEKAKHTAVLVENAGEKPVKISVGKSIFSAVASLFKPKPRQLGSLRNKGSVEFIGDWEVSPEELFDEEDGYEEYSLNHKNIAKEM